MSRYSFNRVGRLVVILAVCLVAGYYIVKPAPTAVSAVAEKTDAVEGEALKQPLKKAVDMKDKAFTGFKPF